MANEFGFRSLTVKGGSTQWLKSGEVVVTISHKPLVASPPEWRVTQWGPECGGRVSGDYGRARFRAFRAPLDRRRQQNPTFANGSNEFELRLIERDPIAFPIRSRRVVSTKRNGGSHAIAMSRSRTDESIDSGSMCEP